MNTIDINVKVELNMSDDTKAFFGSLFQGQVAAPKAAVQPEAKQPVAKSSEPAKKAVPEIKTGQPSPVAEEAASADTEAYREELRIILNKKVNEHRPAIKEMLKKLEAKSLTTLNAAHLETMGQFLKAL